MNQLRHRRLRQTLTLAAWLCAGFGLLALSACASGPGAMVAASAPTLSAEHIARLVDDPDRSAADRSNDLRRKPQPMLAFIGVRPGTVALDVSAAGGYTTELLARASGPTGLVYGQSPPRDPNRAPPPPAAPEGNSHPTATPAPVVAAAPPPVRRLYGRLPCGK